MIPEPHRKGRKREDDKNREGRRKRSKAGEGKGGRRRGKVGGGKGETGDR